MAQDSASLRFLTSCPLLAVYWLSQLCLCGQIYCWPGIGHELWPYCSRFSATDALPALNPFWPSGQSRYCACCLTDLLGCRGPACFQAALHVASPTMRLTACVCCKSSYCTVSVLHWLQREDGKGPMELATSDAVKELLKSPAAAP